MRQIPKTLLQKNLCNPVFIAALFMKAKTWKQHKCPSVDEWIKKAVAHLHDGILLDHKKEKGILLFATA